MSRKPLVLILLAVATSCTHAPTNEAARNPASLREHALPPQAVRVKRMVLSAARGQLDSIAPEVELPKIPSAVVDPSLAEISTCLEAMCGSARGNWSSDHLDQRPGVNLAPQRVWEKEFLPRLTRFAGHYVAADRLYLTKVEAMLARAPLRDLPLPLANLVKINRLHRILDEQIIDWTRWPKVKIDEAALRQYMDGLKSDEARDLAKAYLKTAFENLYLRNPQVVTDGINNAIAIRLGLAALPSNQKFVIKTALRADGQALLATSEKIKQRIGADAARSLIGSSELELFKRAAKGGDFSAEEGDTYVEAANILEHYAAMIVDEKFWQMLSSEPFDVAEEFASLKRSSFTRDWRSWLDEHSVDAMVQAISSDCYPRLYKAVSYTASGLRVAQAQKMIADVKRAATNVAKAYYAGQADEDLFANVQFTNPETSEDVYNRLRHELDSLEAEEEATNASPASDPALFASALMLASTAAFESRMDGLKSFHRKCVYLPVTTISDRALSLDAKIRLSWYAANYPEAGAPIVAHEIGHVFSQKMMLGSAISKLFSAVFKAGETSQAPQDTSPYGKYLELRDCATKRNPYYSPYYHGSSSPWSEEDTADTFSSKVMRELARMHSPWASGTNVACALAEIKDDEYAETTLKSSDEHSSHVLRLILIGHDRGALKPQCQPIVDKLWKERSVPSC